MDNSWKEKGVFQLFRPKRRFVLGVDINSTSVTLLEISVLKGQHQIEGYACMALPEGVMGEEQVKDIARVSACIKTLYSTAQFKSKQAILAVPDAHTLTQIIQISEGLDEEEQEAAVWLQAEAVIPYPLHEMSLDFNCIGRCETHPGLLNVQWVAARTEFVHGRAQAARLAGLYPQIVEIESAAVTRALRCVATGVLAWENPKQLFQQKLSQVLLGDCHRRTVDLGSKVDSNAVIQDAPQLLTAYGLTLRTEWLS